MFRGEMKIPLQLPLISLSSNRDQRPIKKGYTYSAFYLTFPSTLFYFILFYFTQ